MTDEKHTSAEFDKVLAEAAINNPEGFKQWQNANGITDKPNIFTQHINAYTLSKYKELKEEAMEGPGGLPRQGLTQNQIDEIDIKARKDATVATNGPNGYKATLLSALKDAADGKKLPEETGKILAAGIAGSMPKTFWEWLSPATVVGKLWEGLQSALWNVVSAFPMVSNTMSAATDWAMGKGKELLSSVLPSVFPKGAPTPSFTELYAQADQRRVAGMIGGTLKTYGFNEDEIATFFTQAPVTAGVPPVTPPPGPPAATPDNVTSAEKYTEKDGKADDTKDVIEVDGEKDGKKVTYHFKVKKGTIDITDVGVRDAGNPEGPIEWRPVTDQSVDKDREANVADVVLTDQSKLAALKEEIGKVLKDANLQKLNGKLIAFDMQNDAPGGAPRQVTPPPAGGPPPPSPTP